MIVILFIIFIISLNVLKAKESYEFDVIIGQIKFIGKAEHFDEVDQDMIQFCDQYAATCNETSYKEQILAHAHRHVYSKSLLKELDLENLCKGTVVGPDAAVLAQMSKEIMEMPLSPFCSIKKYVEIGTYLGCSSFIIANLTEQVLIYAHDIWVEKMDDLKSISNPPLS